MDRETEYRDQLQKTDNLVVAFFEKHEQFPEALEDVRRQIATLSVVPNKSCILYRTKCGNDTLPRWRVWSQLVPFEDLVCPEEPSRPWVGLDRKLNRMMTDAECATFLREKRYEIYEIRVSRR
jgi:hypothetical protein